ncbi:MAG: hypothetical protein ACI9T7_000831, partial [Oleiphilaceae bacterium]
FAALWPLFSRQSSKATMADAIISLGVCILFPQVIFCGNN